MARIPLLTRDSDVGPHVREVFDSVEQMGLERFMNQFAALAHHPSLMHAMHGLMRVYYQQSVVDKKYLELAILMVSRLNRCHYCVVHHTPPALNYGVTAAQLQAIDDGSWRESEIFDPVERAVLRFAEQMNKRQGRIDDSLFTELSETFDRAQIVELTVRVGMCEFFNRFNEALQLEIEPVAEALFTQSAAR
ncbi:MAG: carboxymuconolactone decarboxylase family protein [Betaproteobacteria bacterium]|nr:MAG: carboxymuconolactone decarboxylase family protein [Betaproteobacteria bacterium]